MLSTARTVEVSSENCQKPDRLGNLENSFNSLIERLLGIYYEREKKTTTRVTENRRAGIGEPKNPDMDIVAEGKRFMDDSKTNSEDVIISSYSPRCCTNCCLECRRHYLSEVCKK
ncbi:MAG TPA: hypothetical protein VI037_06690 [Nitrososphaera sp.]